MKTPNYVLDDELYHHGIEGQKWHRRRYQNEDGSWTEEGKERRRVDRIKYGGQGREAPLTKRMEKPIRQRSHSFLEDDYIIKKGTKYERFTKNKNEKFRNKMYVGHNAFEYAQSLVKKNGDYYVNKFETKRDTIIAGKHTMMEILESIGGEKVRPIIDSIDNNRTLFDKKGNPYLDFLYKDEYKIANKFIKELRNKGYDGIPDPYDSFINKNYVFDNDATIFINDVLKLVDQEKYGIKMFDKKEDLDESDMQDLISLANAKEKKIKKGGHK